MVYMSWFTVLTGSTTICLELLPAKDGGSGELSHF